MDSFKDKTLRGQIRRDDPAIDAVVKDRSRPNQDPFLEVDFARNEMEFAAK